MMYQRIDSDYVMAVKYNGTNSQELCVAAGAVNVCEVPKEVVTLRLRFGSYLAVPVGYWLVVHSLDWVQLFKDEDFFALYEPMPESKKQLEYEVI